MQNGQFKYAVITHGGAGSSPNDFDGPNATALKSVELLKNGASALVKILGFFYSDKNPIELGQEVLFHSFDELEPIMSDVVKRHHQALSLSPPKYGKLTSQRDTEKENY